jgi:hypothetical protein
LDIFQWFTSSWHWLFIIGALISISGVIFGAYGLLGKSLPKRIVQSFSFGIVGGIVGGLIGLVWYLLAFVTSFLVYNKNTQDWQSIIFQFYLKQIVFNGLVFGIIIGALSKIIHKEVTLTSKKSSHVRKIQRKVNWLKNTFLFSISLVLLISFAIIEEQYPTGQPGPLHTLNVIICFVGFAIGYIYDRTNIQTKYIILFFVLVFLSFIGLVQISMQENDINTFAFFYNLMEFINFYSWLFLLGQLFNQSKADEPPLNSNSWRNFYSFAGLGLICGIVFILFSHYHFEILDISQFAAAIGLLIAFGCGYGNDILIALKPQIRLKERGKIALTKNNWERFRIGFLIALVYFIVSTILVFLSLYIDGGFEVFPFPYVLPLFGLPYFIFITIITFSVAALFFALITGSLYCFGPVLSLYIDNISEDQMKLIGVILTIIGILIALPPVLF